MSRENRNQEKTNKKVVVDTGHAIQSINAMLVVCIAFNQCANNAHRNVAVVWGIS
jgi:hypothetical protein